MVANNTKQVIYIASFRLAALLSVLVLLSILFFIFKMGAHVVDAKFLTSMWHHRDIAQGGIFQAIVGTILLAVGVSILSIPIGICTAIYLNEYAADNLFTRMIRISIRNLAGVPSIVYGIFGLAFFVLFLNLGTSLISASLTLGAMTLPWIITTSEESLKAVPLSFREGSYALGATKLQTIWKTVLPNSFGGMMTGSILGVSRAMGETAPIIMVGATFFMSGLPTSIFDKFMTLPYHIFILATQHSSPNAKEYALGTALILVSLIFILNFGIFFIRYRMRSKKEW